MPYRSDLRQIPDNQEVFLSPSSDTSVVIVVLAMVEEGMARDDLWEAVKYVLRAGYRAALTESDSISAR